MPENINNSPTGQPKTSYAQLMNNYATKSAVETQLDDAGVFQKIPTQDPGAAIRTADEVYTYNQSLFSDFGASIADVVTKTAVGGAGNLVPTVANMLSPDEKGFEWANNWTKGVDSWMDSHKFEYDTQANKSLFDGVNSHNIAKGLGAGVGSIMTVLLGGGAAGRFASSALMYLPTIREEAIKAGLNPVDTARVAVTMSTVLGAAEYFGLEALMGHSFAKPAVKQLATESAKKSLINLAKHEALTPELVYNAVKETNRTFSQGLAHTLKKMAGGVGIEGGEEFGSVYLQEGLEQAYDTLFASDQAVGQGKFGADVRDSKVFKEGIESAFFGSIIGAGMSTAGAMNSPQMQESLFTYIGNSLTSGKTQKIDELKQYATQSAQDGKISQEEAEGIVENIDSFVTAQKSIPAVIEDKLTRYQAFQFVGSKKNVGKEIADLNAQNAAALDPALTVANDFIIKKLGEKEKILTDAITQIAQTKNAVDETVLETEFAKIDADIENHRKTNPAYKQKFPSKQKIAPVITPTVPATAIASPAPATGTTAPIPNLIPPNGIRGSKNRTAPPAASTTQAAQTPAPTAAVPPMVTATASVGKTVKTKKAKAAATQTTAPVTTPAPVPVAATVATEPEPIVAAAEAVPAPVTVEENKAETPVTVKSTQTVTVKYNGKDYKVDVDEDGNIVKEPVGLKTPAQRKGFSGAAEKQVPKRLEEIKKKEEQNKKRREVAAKKKAESKPEVKPEEVKKEAPVKDKTKAKSETKKPVAEKVQDIFHKHIENAVSERELDAIVDQIDASGDKAMTSELITAISKKRDTFKKQEIKNEDEQKQPVPEASNEQQDALEPAETVESEPAVEETKQEEKKVKVSKPKKVKAEKEPAKAPEKKEEFSAYGVTVGEEAHFTPVSTGANIKGMVSKIDGEFVTVGNSVLEYDAVANKWHETITLGGKIRRARALNLGVVEIAPEPVNESEENTEEDEAPEAVAEVIEEKEPVVDEDKEATRLAKELEKEDKKEKRGGLPQTKEQGAKKEKAKALRQFQAFATEADFDAEDIADGVQFIEDLFNNYLSGDVGKIKIHGSEEMLGFNSYSTIETFYNKNIAPLKSKLKNSKHIILGQFLKELGEKANKLITYPLRTYFKGGIDGKGKTTNEIKAYLDGHKIPVVMGGLVPVTKRVGKKDVPTGEAKREVDWAATRMLAFKTKIRTEPQFAQTFDEYLSGLMQNKDAVNRFKQIFEAKNQELELAGEIKFESDAEFKESVLDFIGNQFFKNHIIDAFPSEMQLRRLVEEIKYSNENSKTSMSSTTPKFQAANASPFDMIGNNKSMYNSIAESLKKLFPEIEVRTLDKVKGETSDQVAAGRAYLEGLKRVVEWSMIDGRLDTAPHEYAHHYIDMFRNTGIVQEGIAKFGEEGLVQKIGELYVKRMNLQSKSPFVQWANKFWSMVRSSFGHTSVIESLTDEFAKATDLYVKEGTVNGARKAGRNKSWNQISNLFHGSSVNVATTGEGRFSLQYSGTGSGTEAYAWGLFFTDTKQIADIFKERSSTYKVEVLGRELDGNTAREVQDILDNKNIAPQDKVEFVKDALNENSYINPAYKTMSASMRSLSDIKAERGAFMHEVTLHKGKSPADYKYISWDSEIPESVFKGIKELAAKEGVDILERTDYASAEMMYYDMVAQFGGNKQAVSQFLLRAGVDGMTVETQKVSKVPSGTNYIVFDDSAVSIETVIGYQTISQAKNTEYHRLTSDVNNFMHIKNIKGAPKSNYLRDFRGAAAIRLFRSGYKGFKGIERAAKIKGDDIASLITSADSADHAKAIDYFKKAYIELKHSYTKQATGLNGAPMNVIPEVKLDKLDRLMIKGSQEDLLEMMRFMYLAKTTIKLGAIPYSKATKSNYMTLAEMNGHLIRIKANASSYFVNEKENIGKRETNEIVFKEIEARDNKMKNVPAALRKVIEFANKNLKVQDLQTVIKGLTGGENAMVYNLLYEPFRKGETEYARVASEMTQILNKFLNKDTVKWTTVMDSRSFSQTEKTKVMNYKGQSFELSKAEALNIYLALRQARYADTHLSKLDENGKMKDTSGFVLQRKNEGAQVIHLSEGDWIKLKKQIESDVAMKPVLSGIDTMMDKAYERRSRIYNTLTGGKLGRDKHYFPITIGMSGEQTSFGHSMTADSRHSKARTGTQEALRVSDTFSVLNNYINDTSAYYAYSLPLHNMKQFIGDKKVQDRLVAMGKDNYIKYLTDFTKSIEDRGLLYGMQNLKLFGMDVQKMVNAFTVSAIGANPTVIIKQLPAFKLASGEFGDNKGVMSVGMSAMSRVIKSGFSKYQVPMEDPTLKEIEKRSPLLTQRLHTSGLQAVAEHAYSTGGNIFKGGNMGEMLKNREAKPMLKWLSEKSVEGIKIADAGTIAGIWESSKEYIRQNFPQIKHGSEQYWTAVENKAVAVMVATQPTYDATHRTGLARDTNPLLRMFTLFMSQPAKNLNMMIRSLTDIALNPGEASTLKLRKTMVNVLVFNALMMGLINAGRDALMGNDDDEDDDTFAGKLALGMITDNLNNLPFIGVGVEALRSRLDDKNYTRNISHPVFDLINLGFDTTADVAKGNLEKGADKAVRLGLRTAGLPQFPFTFAKKMFQGEE